ncbi:hypothetical protein MYX78_01605 [Acidobacteria bacterium AH-259-G07]|nr:hypothetical protein [Acidobacteria bacterium AH-259-G07]
MRANEPITNNECSSAVFLLYCSIVLLLYCSSLPALQAANDRVCIIITGLGGVPEYEENFLRWSSEMETVFRNELNSAVYNLDGREQKKPDILQVFDQVSLSLPLDELWLFLIGHANHDGRHYKFNIAGPDLTDEEIKTFLEALGRTRTYIIAATSASGILASRLGQKNRVVVTATRNQFERQPPLFMSFFVEAVTSAEADTDKNGKISLLEAFLFSNQKVDAWFKERGRIQTEHSLLDDNGQARLGESQGTLGSDPGAHGTFLASRAFLSAPPEQAYRSLEAKQLASERVEIERNIEDLKFRKTQIPEDKYYRTLEELLVKLAQINEKIEQLEAGR